MVDSNIDGKKVSFTRTKVKPIIYLDNGTEAQSEEFYIYAQNGGISFDLLTPEQKTLLKGEQGASVNTLVLNTKLPEGKSFTKTQASGKAILTDGSKIDITPFTIYAEKGENGKNGVDGVKGDKGNKGDTGVGIQKINFTEGFIKEKGKEYTETILKPKIVYSDGTTQDCLPVSVYVENGKSGKDGRGVITSSPLDYGDSFRIATTYTDGKMEVSEPIRKLPGKDGKDGKDGKMTFEDLTPSQRESLKGDKGDAGYTIEDIVVGDSVSNLGNTTTPITFKYKNPDGTIISSTPMNIVAQNGVNGRDGADGVSIRNISAVVTKNDDGLGRNSYNDTLSFHIELSNNTSFNTSPVSLPSGRDGGMYLSDDFYMAIPDILEISGYTLKNNGYDTILVSVKGETDARTVDVGEELVLAVKDTDGYLNVTECTIYTDDQSVYIFINKTPEGVSVNVAKSGKDGRDGDTMFTWEIII